MTTAYLTTKSALLGQFGKHRMVSYRHSTSGFNGTIGMVTLCWRLGEGKKKKDLSVEGGKVKVKVRV